MDSTLHSFTNAIGKTRALQAGIIAAMQKRLKPRNHDGREELILHVARVCDAIAEKSRMSNADIAKLSNKRISMKSAYNLRNPQARMTATGKGQWVSTKLLAGFAYAAGMQLWELLHPDYEQARREHAFYEKAKAAIAAAEWDEDRFWQVLATYARKPPPASETAGRPETTPPAPAPAPAAQPSRREAGDDTGAAEHAHRAAT